MQELGQALQVATAERLVLPLHGSERFVTALCMGVKRASEKEHILLELKCWRLPEAEHKFFCTALVKKELRRPECAAGG